MNHEQSWRFIPVIEASGKLQMAIDSWLLERHKQGIHPPTLRFYTWSPAAISCGYHQQHIPTVWRELTWQGKPLEIIRRPTGGQGVLHQGDLTYAIVTSVSPGKRLETYQYICQFLMAGWRSLGVELQYGTSGREYAKNPNCFATSTIADLITSDGKKAIGSAQLRRGKAILQHGSICLSTDANLFEQIFQQESPSNLLDFVANSDKRNQTAIVEALKQAARNCFQIDLWKQPLSENEWNEIRDIVNRQHDETRLSNIT
jgi:lipoate-protein ligase A